LCIKLTKNKDMRKITVFECEFCNRTNKRKGRMKEHEDKCFKNPESKSCITCKNMVLSGFIQNRRLTHHEEQIMMFKIEGTFKEIKGDMECDYNELLPEYQYLDMIEYDNLCVKLNQRLIKLRTQCQSHNTI